MKEVSLPKTRVPTLQFSQTNLVSGFAGVNRFTAEATLSGKNILTWTGPAAATKMAGPPEAMSLENQYLDSLQQATRVELSGKTLTLTSPDGSTRLVFSR